MPTRGLTPAIPVPRGSDLSVRSVVDTDLANPAVGILEVVRRPRRLTLEVDIADGRELGVAVDPDACFDSVYRL